MATLEINNVIKRYEKTQVLHGIDLNVKDGEFVVFVGPSGCGKSTLLRMIAGLENISSGEVMIDGKRMNELTPADRGIAMVFQSYALYPHKDVFGNMAFALKHAGVDRKLIEQRVNEAAQILGLEPLLKRRPKALSGGQRQRVAIGRAIVRDPKIFLFDEPLSNLDAALRVQMRVEILKLHQRLKTTMIYVTHDQVEAMTLADRIVVLKDGNIEQVGTPMDLYHQPNNQFVAQFIGSPKMNFIPSNVKTDDENNAFIELENGARLGNIDTQYRGNATLGIRPEHMEIIDEAANEKDFVITGTVIIFERLGGETLLHIRLHDHPSQGELICKVVGDQQYQPEQIISLRIMSDHLHLFDEDGLAIKQSVATSNY